VAHVVEQGGRQDRRAVFSVDVFVAYFRETIQKAPGVVHYPNRVRETAVVRGRKDEFGHPKLLNAPQPLELACIDQVEQQLIALVIIKRDNIVNWITDDFGPQTHLEGTSLPAAIRK
jgi:hypothetical protein